MKTLPTIEILYSYVQPSTVLLDALISAHVQGIVFAGGGAGGISRFEKDALQRVLAMPKDARPILVRSSRVGNGRVTSRDEYDRLDMIPADSLNPQKARILLMLALTKTKDLNVIKRMFAEY
jgi:L-asparaginase